MSPPNRGSISTSFVVMPDALRQRIIRTIHRTNGMYDCDAIPKHPHWEDMIGRCIGARDAGGGTISNRGWQGDPPSDDAEARERIIAAAMRCVDRYGATKTGLADVAAELGVTRQTVYRIFPSAEDLFQAMATTAADTFIDRMVARVSGFTDPAEMLVECLAFTV